MARLLIEFINVGMTFGAHTVFKDLSLKIFEGENVVLMGPSGKGKSVLLKMMLGLLCPTSGTIKVGGVDIYTFGDDATLHISRDVGMLFQGAALFDSLTVFENVAFPLREHRLNSEAEIREIVSEKLRLVGLSGTEEKLPAELSGGMLKRVGLARALSTSPHVMLFDEPTTGLDPTTRSLIVDIIIKLRDTHGITSIIVTHDMESAHRVANRLILIADGAIQADGSITELWDVNKKVHDFVSGHWNQSNL